MKIDALLSYFGGIYELFILVFGFLMIILNEKFMMLNLANKLYDYNDYFQNKFKESKEKRY